MEKKSVECPLCENERVIDANARIKTIAGLADEHYSEYDYYIKCWKCKREIGVRKTITA